jgi:hypothetical protein
VKVERAGKYRLVLNLGVRGDFDFDPGKCRLVFKVGGREVWQQEFVWKDRSRFRFEVEEDWQPGSHALAFELHPLTPDDQRRTSVDMQIFSVVVQGPLAREHWVRPKNSARFFFADEPPQDEARRREYAREVLRQFARNAFRRPADDRTLDRLTAFAEDAYRQPGKSFEQGVARAMVPVLASPRFLFRVEAPLPGQATDRFATLDEYSLASRLSYFLWSTMPDEELTGLADRGELRKNLRAQVSRMLKDRRSQAMIENFTGQWLQVRDLESINIDARVVLARDNTGPSCGARRGAARLRAARGARGRQGQPQPTHRPPARSQDQPAGPGQPRRPSQPALLPPMAPVAGQREQAHSREPYW